MSSENLGCLGFLFSGFRRDAGRRGALAEGDWIPAESPRLPFRVQQNFMTRAEHSFYHVLRQAAGDRFAIFAKVGLGELFYVAQKEDRRSWHNRIDRKHVDFVLCDLQTLQPIAGVELDDSSHERPDRRERDAFVDQVFQDAGLPLIHVPARRSYTVEDLRDSLRIVLTMTEQEVAGTAPVKPVADGVPTCPRCGIPMVLRSAKRSGSQFWGCSNYPRCQQTMPLGER